MQQKEEEEQEAPKSSDRTFVLFMLWYVVGIDVVFIDVS